MGSDERGNGAAKSNGNRNSVAARVQNTAEGENTPFADCFAVWLL